MTRASIDQAWGVFEPAVRHHEPTPREVALMKVAFVCGIVAADQVDRAIEEAVRFLASAGMGDVPGPASRTPEPSAN